eukprot:491391-Rhodomonas_salina.2
MRQVSPGRGARAQLSCHHAARNETESERASERASEQYARTHAQHAERQEEKSFRGKVVK